MSDQLTKTRRYTIHVPQLVGRITYPKQEEAARKDGVEKVALRIVKEFDTVMQELQRFLHYLQDGSDVVVTATGFDPNVPEVVDMVSGDPGDPSIGWSPGPHRHQVRSGAPSGLGNAPVTGVGPGLSPADHVHKRDVRVKLLGLDIGTENALNFSGDFNVVDNPGADEVDISLSGGSGAPGLPLSGSTNGRPIPVAATATPGTLIHTAVAGVLLADEVYVFASNVTGAPATLTVEWGGVGAPGDHIVETYALPANSLPIPIALGQRVQGSVVVRAYGGTASAITITGFYRRGAGLPLSGSTNGRPIPVAAVGTPGTLIHTAVAGVLLADEVYVFASNVTGAPVTLTVEWGGVGAPGDHIIETYSLPAFPLPIPIALGQRLQGSVVVGAYASTPNAINITGFYKRGS